MPSQLWQPGQSGNPKGRPRGAKTKPLHDALAVKEKTDAAINRLLNAAVEVEDHEVAAACWRAVAPYVRRRQPTEVINRDGRTPEELERQAIDQLLRQVFNDGELRRFELEERNRQEHERIRSAEIDALRRRVSELESATDRTPRATPPSTETSDPAAPVSGGLNPEDLQ